MKYLALLLIFGFGLSGFGQTIKSLGYNTTNGQVVASITGFNLEFTNSAVAFRTLAPDNIQFPSTADAIIYYDGYDYLQFRSGDILAYKEIAFTNSAAATTRTNLGLGWSALTNTNAATSLLGVTTNGQVVANMGTNVLTFTNDLSIRDNAGDSTLYTFYGMEGWGAAVSLEERTLRDGKIVALQWGALENVSSVPLRFDEQQDAATTRANLGLGATWLTNTNVTNFRSDIGLGTNDSVTFQRIIVDPSASASALRFGTNFTGLWSGSDADYRSFSVRAGGNNLLIFQTNQTLFYTNIAFDGGASGVVAATTRTNLGLGGGITATNTFVSYNGTNYTTNTVTISNGIITGWTQ